MSRTDVKIVITDMQLDPFKKIPVLVTITIFDQLGVEQLKIPSLPATLFQGNLEIGTRLLLTPQLDDLDQNHQT